MTAEDIKFGKIALELGFINQEQLRQCAIAQQQQKKSFPELMLELRFLSSFQITTINNRIEKGTQDQISSSISSYVSISKPLSKESTEDDLTYAQNIANSLKFNSKKTEFIGRYQILGEIGAGGMGRVYKALDPNLDREVALKVILNQSQKAIQRFILEAKATAKLQHPNIITVHDMGEEQGKFFFTMDLIKGISLKEFIKKNTHSIKQVLEIMEKVARALDYAHKQGVIHRDLKAANIMIDSSGEPKVMDFGLAKLTQKEGTKLSKHGAILGTLYYMPPEQANGELDKIDARSDVYSLGIVLYELLTGRLPFTGDSYLKIILEIGQKNPPAPSKIKPGVPKPLEKICLKAISKQREDRYQSALELAHRISEFSQKKNVAKRAKTSISKSYLKPAKKKIKGSYSCHCCSPYFALFILGARSKF